jgi:hypothetical protein
VIDAAGNWAVASDPYSLAQDVASAVKLFLGELYYDTTKGIPYFQQVLGQWPPLALVRARIEAAALTVPEVVQARCTITAFQGRVITGQVLVIDQDGQEHNVTF